MRRQPKHPDSQILKQNLLYPKDREAIHDILLTEQGHVCAYTETVYNSPSDKYEIDHFNPDLKGTAKDGYTNWYAIKPISNKRKQGPKRWADHQPILHPSSEDVETRIWFSPSSGTYDFAEEDIEAKNLASFVGLNNSALIEERLSYIEDLESIQDGSNQHIRGDLNAILNKGTVPLKFRRIIRDHFGIDLY